MARVAANEATRKRLKHMFEGKENIDRSALIREAVRLMVEEALEAEVSEALERGYFEHGPDRGGGHRNGYRRGAYYVDRILKGTAPADLPVEQPMKIDFVVNLKTARALGIAIPTVVLVRADETIE